MKYWVLLAAACLTAAAQAKQTIDQSVAAEPAGAVELTATSGEVEVVGWEKPQVAVSGEISDSQRLDVQRRGDTVVIRVIDKGSDRESRRPTYLLVHVPAANRIGISVVSADIRVRGLTGGQRLQSVSGDIETSIAAAHAELRSLSGSINVQGQNNRSRLVLNTVSGDVVVRNVSGEVESESVSGDVDLQLGTLDRGRFKTVSGDLRVRGSLSPNSRIEATSVSGDLHFSVPGAEQARALVEAFSGDIRPCFGNVAVIESTYGPGSTWRYGPAQATGDIQVKTLSGDIELCNR